MSYLFLSIKSLTPVHVACFSKCSHPRVLSNTVFLNADILLLRCWRSMVNTVKVPIFQVNICKSAVWKSKTRASTFSEYIICKVTSTCIVNSHMAICSLTSAAMVFQVVHLHILSRRHDLCDKFTFWVINEKKWNLASSVCLWCLRRGAPLRNLPIIRLIMIIIDIRGWAEELPLIILGGCLSLTLENYLYWATACVTVTVKVLSVCLIYYKKH